MAVVLLESQMNVDGSAQADCMADEYKHGFINSDDKFPRKVALSDGQLYSRLLFSFLIGYKYANTFPPIIPLDAPSSHS